MFSKLLTTVSTSMATSHTTLVRKDWAEFDKHRKDPVAQKSAVLRNHEVAEGLAHKFQEVKTSPTKHQALNAHMATQGYLHSHDDGSGNHVYIPLPGNPDGELPSNPVIGHKVHIVINHKTGHVDAVSRYSFN
jgi:hypothetical protein